MPTPSPSMQSHTLVEGSREYASRPSAFGAKLDELIGAGVPQSSIGVESGPGGTVVPVDTREDKR